MTLIDDQDVDPVPAQRPALQRHEEDVVDEDEDVVAVERLVPLRVVPGIDAVGAHEAADAEREVLGQEVGLLLHQGHGVGHEHRLFALNPRDNVEHTVNQY